MILKRAVAAVFALVVGLALGACTSFSDTVTDHWPHFAGGEPNDVPPRPGAPGYANFIAHGQSAQSANAPAGNATPPTAGQTAAIAGQKPVSLNPQPSASAEPSAQYQKPAAPIAPAVAQPGGDPGVAQGGLY
jgi:hypothetical protein